MRDRSESSRTWCNRTWCNRTAADKPAKGLECAQDLCGGGAGDGGGFAAAGRTQRVRKGAAPCGCCWAGAPHQGAREDGGKWGVATAGRRQQWRAPGWALPRARLGSRAPLSLLRDTVTSLSGFWAAPGAPLSATCAPLGLVRRGAALTSLRPPPKRGGRPEGRPPRRPSDGRVSLTCYGSAAAPIAACSGAAPTVHCGFECGDLAQARADAPSLARCAHSLSGPTGTIRACWTPQRWCDE